MVALIKTQKLYKAVLKDDWCAGVNLVKDGAKPNLKMIEYINDHGSTEWSALMRVALGAVHDDKTAKDKLFYAAVEANWGKAERLLEAGVVPDDATMNLVVRRLNTGWLLPMVGALTKAGKTPSSDALHIAFLQLSEDKARILILAGAVAAEATLNKAAFQWTADAGWIRRLAGTGTPVTSAMLMEAMEFPNDEKLQALLEAGAVPDEQVMLNAVDKCSATGVGMIADAFVEAGGKLTAEMLNNAVISGHSGAATALIARGAEMNESLQCYLVNEYGRDGRYIIKDFEKEAAAYKAKQVASVYNQAAVKKPAKASPPRLVTGKKPKLVLSKTGGLSHG